MQADRVGLSDILMRGYDGGTGKHQEYGHGPHRHKTPRDVICEKALRHLLGERCILTCTGADAPGYVHRRVDRAFLEEVIDDFKQRFYVCGPPLFMDAVNGALTDLGASSENVVFER